MSHFDSSAVLRRRRGLSPRAASGPRVCLFVAQAATPGRRIHCNSRSLGQAQLTELFDSSQLSRRQTTLTTTHGARANGLL